MEDKSINKYQVILSTDGKCTIIFNVDHSTEILNTLSSKELQEAWEKIVSMAASTGGWKFKDGAVKSKTPMSYCPIHNVPLIDAISKKTGKPYKFHKLESGEMCWGK